MKKRDKLIVLAIFLFFAFSIIFYGIYCLCKVSESFSKQSFKTYIISLNNEKGRKKYDKLKKFLNSKSIYPQKIDAVNGKSFKTITDICKSEGYEDLKCMNMGQRRDSHLGATGCYLSHLKTLKLISESDNPYGLILEDDSIFIGNDKGK